MFNLLFRYTGIPKKLRVISTYLHFRCGNWLPVRAKKTKKRTPFAKKNCQMTSRTCSFKSREHSHMTSDIFFGVFDLPTLLNQILYYISLFSEIRCSLTYLPTYQSDVICECSRTIIELHTCNQSHLSFVQRTLRKMAFGVATFYVISRIEFSSCF